MSVVATCAFDQWQKDVFFSAAEEVQESADAMESVYRMWVRDRADGSKSDISDELRRELRTVLGTAKWQLEEFERAVGSSYGNCARNDGRIARHGQFVAAIQSQIAHVEKSLSDSLIEEGQQPLRWVQLDDEERDDLAIFLSARPQATQGSTNKSTIVQTYSTPPAKPECMNSFKQASTVSDDFRYVANSEENEVMKVCRKDFDKGTRIDRKSRTWSSPDIGEWRIVIADGEDAEKKTFETRTATPSRVSKFRSLMKNVGKPAKTKWPINVFQKERSGEHVHLKNGISSYLDLKRLPWLSQGRNDSSARHIGLNENLEISRIQQFCGHGAFKKQYNMQFSGFSPSLRITLLLILVLFLFVPFVLYSN